MWIIDLPDRELQLLLTPRWADLDPPLQWGLLVLVGLGPLLLAAWLYRRELRPLPSRVAGGLLALRLLVVSLVWFLLALQPVLVHTTTEEVPGYVLVALDRSASMEVADPDITRTEAARRVLSEQGLGLLRQLRSKHHLHLIAFDKDTWDIDLNRVDHLPRAEPGAATNLHSWRRHARTLRDPTGPGVGRDPVVGRTTQLGNAARRPGAGTRRARYTDFPDCFRGKATAAGRGPSRCPGAPGNVFKNVDAEVRARIRPQFAGRRS